MKQIEAKEVERKGANRRRMKSQLELE